MACAASYPVVAKSYSGMVYRMLFLGFKGQATIERYIFFKGSYAQSGKVLQYQIMISAGIEAKTFTNAKCEESYTGFRRQMLTCGPTYRDRPPPSITQSQHSSLRKGRNEQRANMYTVRRSMSSSEQQQTRRASTDTLSQTS